MNKEFIKLINDISSYNGEHEDNLIIAQYYDHFTSQIDHIYKLLLNSKYRGDEYNLDININSVFRREGLDNVLDRLDKNLSSLFGYDYGAYNKVVFYSPYNKTDFLKDKYESYKDYYEMILFVSGKTNKEVMEFTGIDKGTFYDLHKKIYDRDYYKAVGVALNLTIGQLNGLLERRTYRLSETFVKDREIVKLITKNKRYKNIDEFNNDLDSEEYKLVVSRVKKESLKLKFPRHNNTPYKIRSFDEKSDEEYLEDIDIFLSDLNIKGKVIDHHKNNIIVYDTDSDTVIIEISEHDNKTISKYSITKFEYLEFTLSELKVLKDNGYKLFTPSEEVGPLSIIEWMEDDEVLEIYGFKSVRDED